MREAEEKSNILFSLPEQFGVRMRIDGTEYSLYAEEGKIYDALFSAFDKNDIAIILYDAPEAEERKPVYITFSEKGMSVETSISARAFPVTYEEFKSAFLSHVKKYAIYFVAPYNYQAIMLLPFDEMVAKMKKRQPEADALVEKINNMM